jgi:hypothetical protein
MTTPIENYSIDILGRAAMRDLVNIIDEDGNMTTAELHTLRSGRDVAVRAGGLMPGAFTVISEAQAAKVRQAEKRSATI